MSGGHAADSHPSPPPPFFPPDERYRREYEWSLVRVQGAVISTFILIGVTVLCGLLRSRVSKPWMKTLATVILFPGSNKLISFVPGLMDQKLKDDLFVLWVAFLTYLGAIANNYSCYRFGDNEDRRISLFMDYIFPWSTIVVSLYYDMVVPEILVPVFVMFWMVLLKFRERRDALSYATRSSFGLVESTKVVYDFMSYQRKTDDVERGDDGCPSPQILSEHNSRYLVGVKDARSTFDEDDGDASVTTTGFTPSTGLLNSDGQLSSLVTLDKIKDQKDKLDKFLPRGEAEKLQDTCLSFALFWMLLAKVAGHDIDTDAYNELISSPNKEPINDEQVKRIFDIIEVEIDFLYQYIYTNYYSIYVKGLKFKFWHLGIVALFLWLTLPLLILYSPQDHSKVYVDVGDRVVDIGITRFVIVMVFVFELGQIFLVLRSNWAKIIYLCHFVEKNSKSKITKLAIRYSTLLSFSFRERKIAQYSLVDSHDSMPPQMCVAYFIKELRLMDVPEIGQTGIQYIPLHLDLKKTFINFIKKSVETKDNKISNGANALAEGGANSLIQDYVHDLGSQSEVILVWHLATHYLQGDLAAGDEQPDARVAITISKYCAYLVVFARKLLPDSGYVAQCAFKKAVKELNNSPKLKDGKEMELNETRQLTNSEKKSITKMADCLKDKLKENFNDHLWKLLAEFWTEMLLYLALSNNFEAIEAHLDYLCTGGEFITHLWALLNHAGCSRDPNVKPKIKTREHE